MTTLVAGATGATGRLLVEELLQRGHAVKAIVRSPDALPENVRRQEGLSLIHGAILDLGPEELARHARGCGAVASCLGHNLSLKGVFGPPRRLVAGATRRLCEAVRANNPDKPVRFVLMCSAGVVNRDLKERISFAQQGVVGLVRLLVPPHADNEQAADFLRTQIGREHPSLEWAVVRPDTLVNETQTSAYQIHPSPTRSAIFNPGKTSRINVAHFMAELITRDETWNQWKGRMPVIYNETGA